MPVSGRIAVNGQPPQGKVTSDTPVASEASPAKVSRRVHCCILIVGVRMRLCKLTVCRGKSVCGHARNRSGGP